MAGNKNQVVSLITCVNFAAVKHKDQRRKDPEQTPYINHPIGVANILITEANVTDVETLMAAILHDTVEDTKTTFEEIAEHFGKNVANIVAEVTDDKNLPKEKRKLLQIEKASGKSDKAKLVSMADKLYNVRDLQRSLPQTWTETRRREYFIWAKDVVDNMRGINANLERALDLVFSSENLLP